MLNSIQMLDIWPSGIRTRLLRWAGVDIHPSARVMAGVYFTAGPVVIGAGVYINVRCLIDAAGGVILRDGVSIGPGVSIISSSHEIAHPRRAGNVTGATVTLGSGTWVGANATLLPGVEVADRVVIAAGAVVARAEQPDTLYAGVPARAVRPLIGGSQQATVVPARLLVAQPGR